MINKTVWLVRISIKSHIYTPHIYTTNTTV